MKVDVMIARFPYGGSEDSDVTDWLAKTVIGMKKDQRIGEIYNVKFNDTPITMTRNLAVKAAQAHRADILVMIDSDMSPDMIPQAQPFWDSTFDFMLAHHGPCMVAAPYCGPPPEELCYVFEWTRHTDEPSAGIAINMIPRNSAANRVGFEQVNCLPTGLIAIDMRVFEGKKLVPPYFDYEYKDPPFNTEKSTTEDCFFTRNATLAGIKVYCNWYSWAGHWKRKRVGPPSVLTNDAVREMYRKAVATNDQNSSETLLFFKSKE